MSYATGFRCTKCGATHPISKMHYRCEECGDYLEIAYEFPGDIANHIKTTCKIEQGKPILKRWQAVLPIKIAGLIDRVTLGEKETPLLEANRLGDRIGLERLYLKCENCMPTGSLKDRSMPLAVLKAMEYGFGTVSIVSSGNAAASLAAYAARAGLKSVVFVRAKANPSKFSKFLLSGAVIVRIDADLAAMGNLYDKFCNEFGWYDCNGTVNPFRCEAKKTCAYEIAAQLDWRMPDWVLIPTSTGNGLVAYGIGSQELCQFGLAEKIPKLVAVQLEKCAPIYHAYIEGKSEITPVVPGESISDTLLNGNPEAGGKVLDWVRKTGGKVLTVTDEEIVEAMRELCSQVGVFSEAAGAVTVAAAKKMKQAGEIKPNDVVVCLITGSGLNQPDLPLKITNMKPEFPLEPSSIRRYLLNEIG